MSDQSFPDELPPVYAERYGSERLQDVDGPGAVEAWAAKQTRAYAEKGIAILNARTENVWRWE